MRDSFKLVRNEHYWLSDADGNQYPYLDEIEFKVIEDDLTRTRALQSGEIDITTDLAQVEQGENINNALNGTFEVFAWRNHGGSTPTPSGCGGTPRPPCLWGRSP